jgi:integrase
MATIYFRLRSKLDKDVSIHIEVVASAGEKITVPTGLKINPKNWNEKSKGAFSQIGFPKKVLTSEIKNIISDLKKLNLYVENSFNNATTNDEEITRDWLKEQINKCFGKTTIDEKKVKARILEENKLTFHTQQIIDNANTRVLQNGKVGLSHSRVKGLSVFQNKIIEFEEDNNTKVYLKAISNKFEKDFRNWLLNTKKYSVGYAGKNFDNLKAICKDAQREGKEVNDYANHLQGFTQSKREKIIITLSFEELKQIEALELDSERLNNARKYILLGCYSSLRYSDLVRLTIDNIKNENDLLKIEIQHKKTGQDVVIPVLPPALRVIKAGLPYYLSDQKLNKYIKEVCELAKINEVIEGDLFDSETNRKVRGQYPKHKLIGTHTFRRSFATNYYKHIPTPVLMEITGHVKESSFLTYIGKPKDKDANAKLMLEYIAIMESKKELETPVKELKAS